MVALGLAYVPTIDPVELPALARACDGQLDELWVWEDCFKQSGVASAAIALANTERLTVGLGLMPTPLRNVALTAMEAATLQRTYPGRFLPGIGHGVQEWMDQIGGRAASPLTLLREYAVALRALLDGESVTTSGRYVKLRDVVLDWVPDTAPLAIGGTGPKTLELAGELADLVLLTWLTSEGLASAREHISRGAAKSGRTPELLVVVIGATGADAHARLEKELPVWGLESVEGVLAAGDAAEFARVVNAHAAAGADRVVIQPTIDEPDLLGFVRFLGEEVRPLLR